MEKSKSLEKNMTQVIYLAVFCILATAGAHLCFKQGVVKLGEMSFSLSNFFGLIWQVVQNFWLMLGVVLFGLSFLSWLFIISRIQLNVIYPIVFASQVAVLTVLSWFIFKEYLSLWQILGIIAIVLGIFLILKP